MSDRLFFSTDAVPERDRFAAFCEGFIRRYTRVDFVRRDKSEFHGTVELQRAGAVDIGCIALTPADSVRTPDLVRDGDDALQFMLVESGRAYQTQLGRGQTLDAGDAIICDCGYPGELNMLVSTRFWTLKVPRASITSLVPDAGPLAGAKLDKDPLALQLLSGYLSGTLNIELTPGERAVQLYDEHIVNLLALALGARREARQYAEQHGVAAMRRAAILREIDNYLIDPKLSAAAVANRQGITPRYLRLLLEQTGRSFIEHVLEKRLERAAALLRDPRQRDSKISAIAFACGFGDLSYFNRVFRQRYGETPSDMRETAWQQRRS
jgi:AraC-like DNA-binding protein